MNIKIEPNDPEECYDLLDIDSDESHDGDGAVELICKAYDKETAEKLKNLLMQ